MLEPIPMETETDLQSRLAQPHLDPRERQALVSRLLVAERHSSFLESEIKRLQLEHESEIKRLKLENQGLNSNLDHTLRSLHIFESETMRLELDNDHLRTRIEEAAYIQWHSTDFINSQLAQREDSLHRLRVREDGLFCACCALLRLPDHFFPAMLTDRVPASRRRCAFCVQAVRVSFDCFGRDFFTPPGFTMPRLHPDDSKRLTNLHRCYSCACVRHISMHFQTFDANILINLAPLDSQSRILVPPPRDAPRARITTQKFLVCVFCRRELLSHTAPPKPPRSRPPEPVPEWEPNPDYPGDCDSPDDSDDLDYIGQGAQW